MWIVEVINALDGYGLDSDGLYARNVGRLWGIFTAPFLHASLPHLIDNTIPFVFMGVIIALRGAARLALVTVIVIVVGGLGTWLIAPGDAVTIGASGVVFGYATYLLTRGLFNRSWLEILVGVDRRRGLGRRAGVQPRAPTGSPGRPTCAARWPAWSPPGCWPARTRRRSPARRRPPTP